MTPAHKLFRLTPITMDRRFLFTTKRYSDSYTYHFRSNRHPDVAKYIFRFAFIVRNSGVTTYFFLKMFLQEYCYRPGSFLQFQNLEHCVQLHLLPAFSDGRLKNNTPIHFPKSINSLWKLILILNHSLH
jgi:hypothetical protein